MEFENIAAFLSKFGNEIKVIKSGKDFVVQATEDYCATVKSGVGRTLLIAMLDLDNDLKG